MLVLLSDSGLLAVDLQASVALRVFEACSVAGSHLRCRTHHCFLAAVRADPDVQRPEGWGE